MFFFYRALFVRLFASVLPSLLHCKVTKILRMAHSLIGFGCCAMIGPPLYLR